MTILANFPLKNQLADLIEVNREFDCVPTSIAACLEWLLKKSFDGGAIKDAVYGKEYQGGTAAVNYVAYCKQQGAAMSALDGTPAQLVADIRFWLGQGQPLIATEPDPYVNASLGWTHVIAFYGADTPPGTLTCLDPYGGHPVTLSDAEWVARLQFKQVWKFERIEGEHSMSGVPQGWTDNGTVLICPANHQGDPDMHITGTFRDYILANNWPNSNVALEPGHHVDVLEESNPSLGGGFTQLFRYARLEKPDSGPLAGKVIFAWLGIELAHLQAQNATLSQQLKSEQSQVASLQAEVAQHTPGIDAAKVAERLTALGLLGKQVEQLTTQPF